MQHLLNFTKFTQDQATLNMGGKEGAQAVTIHLAGLFLSGIAL